MDEEKREVKEGEGVKEERRGREMREKKNSWERMISIVFFLLF